MQADKGCNFCIVAYVKWYIRVLSKFILQDKVYIYIIFFKFCLILERLRDSSSMLELKLYFSSVNSYN